jgi:hypothetical protein
MSELPRLAEFSLPPLAPVRDDGLNWPPKMAGVPHCRCDWRLGRPTRFA